MIPYAKAKYDPEYDAYYNPKTGAWIETSCGSPDCEFCGGRPDKHYDKNTTKSGRLTYENTHARRTKASRLSTQH